MHAVTALLLRYMSAMMLVCQLNIRDTPYADAESCAPARRIQHFDCILPPLMPLPPPLSPPLLFAAMLIFFFLLLLSLFRRRCC